MLSDDQLLRYSRQLVLSELDLIGQRKLLDSRVLVVGAGGLGCPLVLYLASSGVGHITIVDHDVVELHNLPRQVLFDEQDVGNKKALVIADKLNQQYPDTAVDAVCLRLTEVSQLPDVTFDLIIDATDTPSVGLVLNAYSIVHRVPLLYLAAVAMEGRLFLARGYEIDRPCLQCYFGSTVEPAGGCHTLGVLAPAVGALGLLGATQALRSLLGEMPETLLCLDAWRLNALQLQVAKSEGCAACGI